MVQHHCTQLEYAESLLPAQPNLPSASMFVSLFDRRYKLEVCEMFAILQSYQTKPGRALTVCECQGWCYKQLIYARKNQFLF